MADPRDYKLDISSMQSPDDSAEQGRSKSNAGRPFLSVTFACCNVYQRIYRSNDGLTYEGRCPKCGKAAKFVVGAGGTDSRSFVVE